MPKTANKKISPSSWANPRLIREILEDARVVAIVGISDSPSKPSFNVARYLIEQGYRVVGVNPSLDEVLGTDCYPSLEAIPEPVDVVDVFRKPDAVEAIVDEAIHLRIPYLWLQEGVVNEEAAQKAKEAGIRVVMDRCMMHELKSSRLKL
jgi:predicted CoA-binding protein